MSKNKRAALRRAGGALLLSTVALGAQAMEDESIYSYTLVEAGAGKVRGQSGSVQSLAIDGWVGGDFNRLWYSLDAERRGGRTEAAELQLLYGRYIAPFWDAQIGLRRDEQTLQPHAYYQRFVERIAGRTALLIDPMLATGGSAIAAIDALKAEGAARIKAIFLVAAPEGLRALEAAHPDTDVFVAAIDERLNDRGYILPGLGDAGDRIFGTPGQD